MNLTRFTRIIRDTRLLRRPAEAVQIRSRRICHGAFAPNSKHRVEITPAGRSKKDNIDQEHIEQQNSQQRHRAMTSMQRLKRVFDIDIQTCEHCGGHVKVIACIEDPKVIQQILDHLAEKNNNKNQHQLPQERAPPPSSLFNPTQSCLFD